MVVNIKSCVLLRSVQLPSPALFRAGSNPAGRATSSGRGRVAPVFRHVPTRAARRERARILPGAPTRSSELAALRHGSGTPRLARLDPGGHESLLPSGPRPPEVVTPRRSSLTFRLAPLV